MNRIKVVLVDDEYFNRDLLRLLIARANDYEVVGMAASVREAEKLIRETEPDVVFIDIKMPDGSAFTLLENFALIPFWFVFVTGFDEYAIRQFRTHAYDCILKPVDIDKFNGVIKKLALAFRSGNNNHYLGRIRLPVYGENGVRMLQPSEIVTIKEKNGKVVLCTDGSSFVSKHPLSAYQPLISQTEYYCQAGDGEYLNISRIKAIVSDDPMQVLLKNGTTVDVRLPRAVEQIKALF